VRIVNHGFSCHHGLFFLSARSLSAMGSCIFLVLLLLLLFVVVVVVLIRVLVVVHFGIATQAVSGAGDSWQSFRSSFVRSEEREEREVFARPTAPFAINQRRSCVVALRRVLTVARAG
jgi:hypothetical protein